MKCLHDISMTVTCIQCVREERLKAREPANFAVKHSAFVSPLFQYVDFNKIMQKGIDKGSEPS
jgi:hypothetical protein